METTEMKEKAVITLYEQERDYEAYRISDRTGPDRIRASDRIHTSDRIRLNRLVADVRISNWTMDGGGRANPTEG